MAKGIDAGSGGSGRYIHRNVELQIAISRFQKAGGEYGVGLAMWNAAYGRGEFERGEGRSTGDAEASKGGVPTPGRVWGRPAAADEATDKRHTPGHSTRGKAAMDAIQAPLARSLFDSILLPDGRR